MNPLIQFLIETKGIPETSIILLLMLPIVATVIAFWRQIIGLKTFGIYAPIVMTFTFYQLSIAGTTIDIFRGLKYGLTLAVVVFITASIAHEITKKIRLHYLPKMSIVLSVVALGVFSMLAVAGYFNKEGLLSIDSLPLLLMITVSEQFISIYIKKGRKSAYLLTISTLFISILVYLLIAWETLQNLMFKYPYISFAMIIVNLIIGKWTGFRFNEFLRFKSLLTKDEND